MYVCGWSSTEFFRLTTLLSHSLLTMNMMKCVHTAYAAYTWNYALITPNPNVLIHSMQKPNTVAVLKLIFSTHFEVFLHSLSLAPSECVCVCLRGGNQIPSVHLHMCVCVSVCARAALRCDIGYKLNLNELMLYAWTFISSKCFISK